MTGLLEKVLPDYDQNEQHSRLIAAPPVAVWRALDELRVKDLTMSMALLRMRGGPKAWLHGVEAPPEMRAIEAFAPRPMVEDAPHEIVLGDISRYASVNPTRADIPRGDLEAFEAFKEPGWSKVAMNFRLTPQDGGTLLFTETRVWGTDAAARNSFRLYWALVRLGSGLIRRDILDGVARTVK